MDLQVLLLLIRDKLQDGRLPYESIARVWSSPSDGEMCDACEARIAKDQSVTEVTLAGGSRAGAAIRFHVECSSSGVLRGALCSCQRGPEASGGRARRWHRLLHHFPFGP